MSEGPTCYERDEILCDDEMCLRTGCRLRNKRLEAERNHGWRTDLENAPRDTAVWILWEGNPYLGYCEAANWLRTDDMWFAKATVVRCQGKIDSIYCCHGVDVKPTHWQSLPDAPVSA